MNVQIIGIRYVLAVKNLETPHHFYKNKLGFTTVPEDCVVFNLHA